MEHSRVPALLIAGTADHNIPMRHSAELMRTAGAHAAFSSSLTNRSNTFAIIAILKGVACPSFAGRSTRDPAPLTA